MGSVERHSELPVDWSKESMDAGEHRWRESAGSNGSTDALSLAQPNNDPSTNALSIVLKGHAEKERVRQSHSLQEMSFEEYLQALVREPTKYVRSPAQYQVDALEHYGFEKTTILGKEILDFKVKRFPWQSRGGLQRELVGQELATYEYYKLCQQLAKDERPSGLICAHGAPGGGKSTFFQMRNEMLEDYSKNSDKGALYRLVWVFPPDERKGFGFLQGEEATTDGRFTIRIPADNNTDPFFLLPNERGIDGAPSLREEILNLATKDGVNERFNQSYFMSSGLDPLSQMIFEELLKEYKGDIGKIFEKHVRVERWHYAEELGRGIVSLRPNPDPHADVRPIAPQYNGYPIPPVLRNIAGDLHSSSSLILNGNRGIVHYSDMFRPNQMDRGDGDLSRFNNLLETIEGGVVQVLSHRDPSVIRNVQAYILFTADTNDEHILQKYRGSGFDALSERIFFLSIPLGSRFMAEAQAYRGELAKTGARMAPGATEMLSLFNTATRLLTPDPDYPGYKEVKGLPELIAGLSTVDKALLLDETTKPLRREIIGSKGREYSAEELRLLEANAQTIAEEHVGGVGKTRFALYDGGMGISTRVGIKMAKTIAAQREEVSTPDVERYLKEAIQEGLPYYNEIAAARAKYVAPVTEQLRKERPNERITESDVNQRLDKLFPVPNLSEILTDVIGYGKKVVRHDVSEALGIREAQNAESRLMKYVLHVRAYLNAGNFEVPREYRLSQMRDDGKASEEVMRAFENEHVGETFSSDAQRRAYRETVFTTMTAWHLDNPNKVLSENLSEALPQLLEDIRRSDQRGREQKLARFLDDTVYFSSHAEQLEEDLRSFDVTKVRRAQEWRTTVERLEGMGYSRHSLAEHVVWAIGDR